MTTRPLPQPTALTQPFWDGCREHRLTVQQCSACATFVFIPQAFCPACLSPDLAWVGSTGRGTIVTYTVVWRPQTPAFEAPYIVAVVRLDEGYEMLTNVVDVDPDDVAIGAPVSVRFVDVTKDVALPCFTLVPAP